MRIVGGKFRSKRIIAPSGTVTRPTTDRVRESLFNILANRVDFAGARVIDLFAGSGALGLEAMSRGASFCLFVDDNHKSHEAIRRNVDELELSEKTSVFRRDATRLGPIGTMRPFSLAFADPPYGKKLGERAAATLAQGGWLQSSALLVIEEEKGSMPDDLPGFSAIDIRSYGGTEIGLFEYCGGQSI